MFELHAQSANGFISLPERISFWRNFCFSAFFRCPVFFLGILLKIYAVRLAKNKIYEVA